MGSLSKKTASADGFGLTTLTALVITGMIGSGVFVTSGFALESLGSPVAVLAAWIVGGLVALCGAVAYGGLARRLPESGGEYLRRLFLSLLRRLRILMQEFLGPIPN